MFKLASGNTEGQVRVLECVHCGDFLSWQFYNLAAAKFDTECPKCNIRAQDYWKNKNHRKVEEEAQEDAQE